MSRLVVKEPRGKLELQDAERYTPQQGEILIENVAVAQNPVDWKQRGTQSTSKLTK
jgi:NADPH:quinone reductase-like Zn-dependent oxidoreductase